MNTTHLSAFCLTDKWWEICSNRSAFQKYPYSLIFLFFPRSVTTQSQTLIYFIGMLMRQTDAKVVHHREVKLARWMVFKIVLLSCAVLDFYSAFPSQHFANPTSPDCSYISFGECLVNFGLWSSRSELAPGVIVGSCRMHILDSSQVFSSTRHPINFKKFLWKKNNPKPLTEKIDSVSGKYIIHVFHPNLRGSWAQVGMPLPI